MDYEPRLVEVIALAAARFYEQLDIAVPFIAPTVRDWIASLYGSVPLSDAFRLPSAFPMLLLPWALEQTLRREPDTEFQAELAFSGINGYHHIRLLDNAMDGDAPPPRELLPVVGVFYFHAHAPYQRYFGHDHVFWKSFAAIWLRCVDLTALDATLTQVDRATFIEVAGRKTSAGKIPLAGVCARYNRPDVFERWSRFHDILGCWHQMTNDLRDWQTDLEHHNATFFLSEGARRRSKRESLAEWVAREGYAWAVGVLQAWMAEMQAAAAGLDSPALIAYLDARQNLQTEWHTHQLEVLPYVTRMVGQLRHRLGDD